MQGVYLPRIKHIQIWSRPCMQKYASNTDEIVKSIQWRFYSAYLKKTNGSGQSPKNKKSLLSQCTQFQVYKYNRELKLLLWSECKILFLFWAVRRRQFNPFRRRFGTHTDSFLWSKQDACPHIFCLDQKTFTMKQHTANWSVVYRLSQCNSPHPPSYRVPQNICRC